jgi:pimeloyl-ACP methyl ester carboxylesterase
MAMEIRTIDTPHVPIRCFEAGKGEPLVFFHGAGGVTADDPLLAKLAETFHVYAPLLPGYGDSLECNELRDMLDFTLHGWDVIAALGLEDPILAGHSMGGMIAAEMAAIAPNDVSRLALIAPAGLWLDAHPIPDLFATVPYQLPRLMFHDIERGKALMTAGVAFDDTEWLKRFLITNARQLGMAGRILFPIPERGLAGRLYRIKARTLLVWGDDDRFIVPAYADAFRNAIPHAELAMIPDAGHLVTIEKPEAVAEALARFR